MSIYLTDRSRIVTREECERKRFNNYDYPIDGKPTGLQRRQMSLPLLNGEWIHEGHARVLAGQPIEKVVGDIRQAYSADVAAKGVFGEADTDWLIREQTHLVEGMLRGFALVQMPRILDEYEVVSIEESWDWHLAEGLVQKMRMDALLRRRSDKLLHILDYKALAYASEDWRRKQERTRQTSLYTLAVQEHYGEAVGGIMYVASVKGSWKTDNAKLSPFYGQKIQHSPYLYAYQHPQTLDTQTAWTNRKGFVKFRTYEQMSMEAWVNWLQENEPETLAGQFIFVPPILPTPKELQRVKTLVIREELTYIRRYEHWQNLQARGLHEEAQDYLDYVLAPMREEACYKYGGEHVCMFCEGICFNDGADPLADGDFEPRIPHHSTELEG